MNYDPNPLYIGEVKSYVLTQLKPALWEPYKITTLPEGPGLIKSLCRQGQFCLSALGWKFPGQVGIEDFWKARVGSITNRLLALQKEDGRWEWKGDAPDLSDAFPTAEATRFLLRASQTSFLSDPSPPYEAARRGAQWLVEGKLEYTSPSAGHPGPPWQAALHIQNWNFLGTLLQALRPWNLTYPQEILEISWALLRGQQEEGTWWWYGTDEVGRTTFRISYHDLVLRGLASVLASPPLVHHLNTSLSLGVDYMIRQQLPQTGGLRLTPEAPEPTPIGAAALSLLIPPPFSSPSLLTFLSTLLRHLLTYPVRDPSRVSEEMKGVICEGLGEWMQRYGGT